MSDAPKAVFLSYASQDAEAARKICDALRAADIEVWFDQSELRGGDAWDQKIRKQIKECALFVPIISANTQARTERSSTGSRRETRITYRSRSPIRDSRRDPLSSLGVKEAHDRARAWRAANQRPEDRGQTTDKNGLPSVGSAKEGKMK